MSRPRLSLNAVLSHATLWMGLMLLLFALAFGFGASVELNRAALLASDAIETTATAVDRDRTRRNTSSGSARYDHYIILSYRDQDGGMHRARRSVSSATYDDFTRGEEMPIRYAAADPDIWELEAGDRDFTGKALVAGVSTLAALSLLCFGLLGRVIARQRRAASSGHSLTAQVTEHRKFGKAKGSHETARAHLVWAGQDVSGPISGTSRPMKREVLPPVGSAVTILVDPRSGRGFWEGEF